MVRICLRRSGFVVMLCCRRVPATAQVPRDVAERRISAFNIGDDYYLATYTQLLSYWQKLDAESDRMTLVDIGKSAEGRAAGRWRSSRRRRTTRSSIGTRRSRGGWRWPRD